MSQSAGEDGGRTWDAAVLGAGAAGMTAALFLARHGRSVLMIDELIGNHMTNAGTVENFPGFPEGISGAELAAALQQQALEAGVQILPATAESVVGARPPFRIGTTSGTREALTVLVCVGSSIRQLGVAGEEEFRGRGVSTCATCDGPLFRDRPVAVIGGGDSAMDEALLLAEFASAVTVVQRGASLTGQRRLRDRVEATPNITVRARTELVRMDGDQQLRTLVLRDRASGVESKEDVAGVFVFVGLEPNTRFLEGLVELDGGGHVVTDAWMQTSVAGIFAAGDIRQSSASQFVSAAGDGATAAIAANRFLEALARAATAPGVATASRDG